MQGEPDVAIYRIHAEGGKDGQKRRRLRALFLAFNFPAAGASLGKCVNICKLKILLGEAEAVILADQRFGHVRVPVVDVAFGVGAQPSNAHIAVDIVAF